MTKFEFQIVFAIVLLGLSSAQMTLEHFKRLSDIPTDQNFSINTFVGDWNVVGAYGVEFLSPRSCPVGNVKKSVTSTLTLTMNWIDVNSSTYNRFQNLYQPSPLNKVILVDFLNPQNSQNFAVSYYDDTLGEALLINTELYYAVALSKSQNIYTNMYLETVNDIFMEAQIPLNATTLLDHYGCTTNYSIVPNFDIDSLIGTFYGNAIFDSLGFTGSALKCFNIELQSSNASNVFNVTQFMIFDDFSSNFSLPFIISPNNDGFLISVADVPTGSIVVNYYDSDKNLFILLTHDGKYAFIISSQPSLDIGTLQSLQKFLSEEGLVVNNQTFYVPPTSCEVSSEFQPKSFLKF